MISSAAYELRGNPIVLQHARKQGKCVLGISQTNAYIDKNGNHHGPADDWHPKVPRPIPRQPHYQPANDPCPKIMRSSLTQSRLLPGGLGSEFDPLELRPARLSFSSIFNSSAGSQSLTFSPSAGASITGNSDSISSSECMCGKMLMS